MKKVYLLIIGILLTVAGISAVNANPSQFSIGSQTGVIASPTYVLAGKATTTLSYSPTIAQSKLDKAIVSFQVTSTTTAPTVHFRVETSFDNTNWFSYNATTTGVVSNRNIYSFTYSTTSGEYMSSGNSTKVNGSFLIDAPAPYNRVIITSPVGNPAFNLYARVDSVKEIR